MADTPEPKAKVARISQTQTVEGQAGPLEVRAKAVWRGEAQVEEVAIISEPWRAPVARTY